MLSTIPALVAAAETVSQLLTAAVLLMALDRLASAVRFTYNAGRFTGRVWFRFGLPALLWLADHVSLIASRIDWVRVAATLRTAATVTAAAVIAAALVIRDAHRRWVGSIEWTAPTIAPAPVAPAVHPLALIADELTALSCSQIRQSCGLRQRCSKSRLIALALA